jgi:hypothetical protein
VFGWGRAESIDAGPRPEDRRHPTARPPLAGWPAATGGRGRGASPRRPLRSGSKRRASSSRR